VGVETNPQITLRSRKANSLRSRNILAKPQDTCENRRSYYEAVGISELTYLQSHALREGVRQAHKTDNEPRSQREAV
jgi:hypothetical protein